MNDQQFMQEVTVYFFKERSGDDSKNRCCKPGSLKTQTGQLLYEVGAELLALGEKDGRAHS